MGHQEKGRPKHRRTHREVVVHVAGGGVLVRTKLAVVVHTTADEGWVACQPFFFKSQIVIDQQRADVSVVAYAVAPHPRIDQNKRKEKQEKQKLLRQRKRRERNPTVKSPEHWRKKV